MKIVLPYFGVNGENLYYFNMNSLGRLLDFQFYLLQRFSSPLKGQDRSGTHQSSNSMDIGSFPEVKRQVSDGER
jgi:hypothetical protein